MKYLESVWVRACVRDHIAQINFCASVCGLHEHACVVTLLKLIFAPVYVGYMSMHA